MNCFLFLLVLVSGACAELSKEAEVNADIRFLKNEMRALKQQQQTEVMALKQQQEVQQAEIEILKKRLAGDSYKDNYRREGIRVGNARPKVIIFCKSRWDLVTLQWFYAVRAFWRRMLCTVNRISCCEWFTAFQSSSFGGVPIAGFPVRALELRPTCTDVMLIISALHAAFYTMSLKSTLFHYYLASQSAFAHPSVSLDTS